MQSDVAGSSSVLPHMSVYPRLLISGYMFVFQTQSGVLGGSNVLSMQHGASYAVSGEGMPLCPLQSPCDTQNCREFSTFYSPQNHFPLLMSEPLAVFLRVATVL